ncbi:3D domain-containing protein [Reinekea marina]|uniref:3D domain-containing protein n=1 Tax=Reinekea marina TaxID=1310421 RepID=A0ABV7WS17_9GAMM|nr:3D domain-containing protein [Reinekea marina]MDN3649293.1 3D domain-containing protein [Reinekea marina]
MNIRLINIIAFMLVATQSCASNAQLNSACSTNWKITGYYTPVESEYNGKNATITVTGIGTLSFNQSFLKDVKMEGWGKTRHDWYLGYYGQRWHKSNKPLNALGQALVIGTAATDHKYIGSGQQFYVNSSAELLQKQVFKAGDVGQKIRKKHVDIYTGEGSLAKIQTWELTGEGTICLI